MSPARCLGVNHLDKNRLTNVLPNCVHTLWTGPMITRNALDKPTVREFLLADHGPAAFDLVVFENFFHECFAALGHKYGAPVVQLMPFAANARVSQWHGNPYGPAYVADFAAGYTAPLTFRQRVQNAACTALNTWANRLLYLPQHRALLDEYFAYAGHERRPDLADMLRNVSLTLINSHPLFGSVAPLVPSFVHVAGMHVGPPEPLPRVSDRGRCSAVFNKTVDIFKHIHAVTIDVYRLYIV